MSWTFTSHNWSDTTVYDELGNIVCTLSIDEDIDEDDQEEYECALNNNARLISAAPDLLNALEELVKSYIYDIETLNILQPASKLSDPDQEPQIIKALSAIKKAKGE